MAALHARCWENTLQEITEWQQVDFEKFHNEIVPNNQPGVIRSLVASWPAVASGRDSTSGVCDYLRKLDAGQAVYTIAAPPEAGGRFFYRDDLKSVNFNRGQIPLLQVLSKLLDNVELAEPHSIAVQALAVREILPEFESDNAMPLMNAGVQPTMWIGNKGRVSPHYDVHRNLACVMAGKREFTLFPPHQIENLYLGPVLDAPGGVPISLVDVQNPDFEKFPRYADALAVAQQTVLQPGDAIFIPSLWWHGVASLEPLNVLVNYWWGGDTDSGISPNDSLLHAMLSIADLDESQRNAWRSFFDYYVFGCGIDPAEHLPKELQDIVTTLSPEQSAKIREFLAQRLAAKP
jgi:hypothetical protein